MVGGALNIDWLLFNVNGWTNWIDACGEYWNAAAADSTCAAAAADWALTAFNCATRWSGGWKYLHVSRAHFPLT